jgi:hypothetical protein
MYVEIKKEILYATGDAIGVRNSDDFYSLYRVTKLGMNRFQNLDNNERYPDLFYADKSNLGKIIH